MSIFESPNSKSRPTVIAALRLPPLPGTIGSQDQKLTGIIDFALRNVEIAIQGKIDAVYIQDMAGYPLPIHIEPNVVSAMTAIGWEVRRSFPELKLGVCLIGPGAKEPLAIANTIGAQFVRIKVFIGAMVRAEGLVQGCSYEAQTYRKDLGIGDRIGILADVHDRDGVPLGNPPIVQSARHAAVYGRADGLVLTGKTFEESVRMIQETRNLSLGTPLYIGGSVNPQNVSQLYDLVDGIIVSKALMDMERDNRSHTGVDWGLERIRELMDAIETTWGKN